jgi:hypothetical protein
MRPANFVTVIPTSPVIGERFARTYSSTSSEIKYGLEKTPQLGPQRGPHGTKKNHKKQTGMHAEGADGLFSFVQL